LKVSWSDNKRDRLLMVPALLFVSTFLVCPLLVVFADSFASPIGVLHHYASAVGDEFFRAAALRTLLICGLVSITTLIIGFPVAYALTRSERSRLVRLLLPAILVAMWLSVLVRSYAWLLLLQRTGVVNALLLAADTIDKPLKLVRSNFGVYVGMTQILLPFMIVTLLPTLRNIPASFFNAAASLGASRVYTLRRVVLPLASGGIVAGLLLTFVLGLGFFITPQILGDPAAPFVSQIIARQVNQLRNFGEASAMSILFGSLVAVLYLLATTLLVPAHLRRQVRT
jgi:putative spermidine/putrescine transport system permease protein